MSRVLLQPGLECTRVIYHKEVYESRGKNMHLSLRGKVTCLRRIYETHLKVKEYLCATENGINRKCIWFAIKGRQENRNMKPLLSCSVTVNHDHTKQQAIPHSNVLKVITSASLDSYDNSICLHFNILLRCCMPVQTLLNAYRSFKMEWLAFSIELRDGGGKLAPGR